MSNASQSLARHGTEMGPLRAEITAGPWTCEALGRGNKHPLAPTSATRQQPRWSADAPVVANAVDESSAGTSSRFPLAVPAHIPRIQAGVPLPLHLRGAVVALGNFDGVHLGHQAVVDRALYIARERGVAAIVATFDPHPVQHFTPAASPFHLTSLDQRQRALTRAGVDAMMVFRFDAPLANVSPSEFVENWLAGVGGVVTGESFRFGKGRAGNIQALAELGAQRELTVATVKPVTLDGRIVSSTRIREALRAGDFATAERLMTRPFAVGGVLQPATKGDRASSVFKTALQLDAYLRPPPGIFAVQVRRGEGPPEPGVARLGPLPLDRSPQRALELSLTACETGSIGERAEIEFVSETGAGSNHSRNSLPGNSRFAYR